MPLLLPPPTAPLALPESSRDDPEALIKEARERQRRRRVRLLAVLVIVGAAAGIALVVQRSESQPRADVQHVPNGPTVNLSAFAGQGLVAFVSRGSLWLLDDGTHSLRRLPLPLGYFTPLQPLFSADGRWLAYLVTSPNLVTPSQLWLAHGDGTDAHVVTGLPVASLVGWSPTHDLLAVLAGPPRTTQPCPCGLTTTLRLVAPGGSTRTLVRAPWVYGAAWSPDGNALAAATLNRRAATLAAYPAAGGSPTVWLRVPWQAQLQGMGNIIMNVAGWWKGVGIGVWLFGNGAIQNNDASPLDLVVTPGATPRLLGNTLSDGTTDVAAPSSDGQLAIVTDHGGGRSAWQDKQVKVCTAAGPCRPVATGHADVTVDPAWLPDATTLAVAEAPNNTIGPWTQKSIVAWFAAHQVWLDNTATGQRHELTAARGATALTWSPDGRSLLFVKNNGLWLLPTLTARPIEIATPLFPAGAWPQYYAQIPWAAQFAWHS